MPLPCGTYWHGPGDRPAPTAPEKIVERVPIAAKGLTKLALLIKPLAVAT